MSNTPRGLPLTSSRVGQIFPILTQAQLDRIAVHGHVRAIQPGQVLVEQGDSTVPFFVVLSGELEVSPWRDTYHHSSPWSIHRGTQYAFRPPSSRSYASHQAWSSDRVGSTTHDGFDTDRC